MVNKSLKETIHLNDENTADIQADYYSPRWSNGDVKIYLTGNSDDTTTANVFVVITDGAGGDGSVIKGSQVDDLEEAVAEMASVKFGNNAINRVAQAITDTEVAGNDGDGTETDGLILFTVR